MVARFPSILFLLLLASLFPAQLLVIPSSPVVAHPYYRMMHLTPFFLLLPSRLSPLVAIDKKKLAAEQKEAELEARGFFDPARRWKGRDVYPRPPNWVYCRRVSFIIILHSQVVRIPMIEN